MTTTTFTIDPKVVKMLETMQCAGSNVHHHIFSDSSRAASAAADVRSSSTRSVDLNVSRADPVQPSNTVTVQQDSGLSIN